MKNWLLRSLEEMSIHGRARARSLWTADLSWGRSSKRSPTPRRTRAGVRR